MSQIAPGDSNVGFSPTPLILKGLSIHVVIAIVCL
jgi:hypothetical protein